MTWEPADALRRIAFLLERSRAGTYRVKAFRGAAATAAATDPEELRARARAGTLSDLPGIGSATEAVIREALAGETPAYLASLEDKAAAPLAEGGDTVRAALRGDLHCHSDWSDGGSPIQEMVLTAVELGHDYLVLTDHSPRLKVANGLSVERLTKQLGVVASINEALPDFRLLKGIEVDILDDGGLDQTAEMLARLDVVVASVHSKLRMAVRPDDPADGRGGVQPAHQRPRPLHRPPRRGRPRHPRPERFDAAGGLRRLRRARRGRRDQLPARAVRPARTSWSRWRWRPGCLFSIDSDAHAPGQLDFQVYGCARAERLGVPLERIVNTWELDRLLAWARPA